ncbi:M48 family metalloprotease [candidate division KSB1 bacterium]|nr:M48 family metalloprotease [candidate division KSB1 bacterium]
MNRKRFTTVGGIVISVIIVVWLISCAVNPVTGKRQFMLMSESDELALGQQTDQAVLQEYGVYNDPELNAYVQRLGQEMGRKTHRSNLNYSFKVLDTPVVNAFAVPGGYVYFTRGIMAHLNNEAEFAGVLGHELGHINARHSAAQYSQMQLAQAGLLAGMIFSEDVQKYSSYIMAGMELLFLKFSRDDEREADDLGVIYSTASGYNSLGMATFFETLERMHPSTGQALPDWFSTHPNPVDRVAAVKQKTAEEQAKYPGQEFVFNRSSYLAHLDGLPFGEDPRQGYVSGNAFYHPGMKFTFPVPQGWQLINSPTKVQMTPQAQDAAILFSLDPSGSREKVAQNFVNETQGTIVATDEISVNGFPARRLITDVPSENGALRVRSYFIDKDGATFVFYGFTTQTSFSQYDPTFDNTMRNFAALSDKSKINVKAPTLRLVTVSKAQALRTLLQGERIAADKLEEMAILNGLQLQDNLPVGTQIKIVTN